MTTGSERPRRFVYVVCGTRQHTRTLATSLRHLRRWTNLETLVVTDQRRNEEPITDHVIDVATPDHLDHHQASIYLKTALHRFVPAGADYCYLDSDIVAVGDPDGVFDHRAGPVTFAPDLTIRENTVDRFSPWALNCRCRGIGAQHSCGHLREAIAARWGVTVPGDWVHWNGGVFLFDPQGSKELMDRWHDWALDTFPDPYWRTRDQGALIASTWSLGLQDLPVLPTVVQLHRRPRQHRPQHRRPRRVRTARGGAVGATGPAPPLHLGPRPTRLGSRSGPDRRDPGEHGGARPDPSEPPVTSSPTDRTVGSRAAGAVHAARHGTRVLRRRLRALLVAPGRRRRRALVRPRSGAGSASRRELKPGRSTRWTGRRRVVRRSNLSGSKAMGSSQSVVRVVRKAADRFEAIRPRSRGIPTTACHAPSVSMYLDQKGDVRACCMNMLFPMGNVEVSCASPRSGTAPEPMSSATPSPTTTTGWAATPASRRWCAGTMTWSSPACSTAWRTGTSRCGRDRSSSPSATPATCSA